MTTNTTCHSWRECDCLQCKDTKEGECCCMWCDDTCVDVLFEKARNAYVNTLRDLEREREREREREGEGEGEREREQETPSSTAINYQ